jgi:hypothetical protein
MKRSFLFIARALALSLALLPTAEAYIDPGTGAMIIQMIGAAVAGALFFFRDLRGRIVAWLRRGRAGSTQPGPHDE